MAAPKHRVGASDHPVYAAGFRGKAQPLSPRSAPTRVAICYAGLSNYSFKGNQNRTDSAPLNSGVRPNHAQLH
jgi:hypothetical protein